MKRLNPDLGLVVAVVLLATAYLWADSRLPSNSLGDPLGPRLFPALIGCGLLLSAVLLVLEMRAKGNAPEPASEEAPHDEAHHVSGWVLLGTAAWLGLYYACMEPAGYLISTFVFLAGMLTYFNRGRWRMNAIIAVTFTLVVNALFTHALGIPLAEGVLHF